MRRLLLVGDIGATKAVLAVIARDASVRTINEATFPSRRFESLDAVVHEFLRAVPEPVSGACFSVAGPVSGGRAWLPNLDWQIEEERLQQVLGIPRVRLVNDLQATAFAIPHLADDQVATIQDGVPQPGGVRAVVAVGTGLGEATLVPEGNGYTAYPTEGGHTDFAPTDEVQRRLLEFLHREYAHVSYERVCSGHGLPNIYRFLVSESSELEPAWLRRLLAEAEDPTPIIVTAGLNGTRRCETCARTLQVFAAILGAETGNLALRSLATGGVYVGGGIPPRLLPVLRSGTFLRAFRHKGPMSELVSRIPLHVILEPRTALWGAVRYALELESRGAAGGSAPPAATQVGTAPA